MQANSLGRYCGKCNKTVVDFTGNSPDEIEQLQAAGGGSVCGRYSAEQTIYPALTATIIAGLAFLPAQAQTKADTLGKAPNVRVAKAVNSVFIKDAVNNTLGRKRHYLGIYFERLPIYADGGEDGMDKFVAAQLSKPLDNSVSGRVSVIFSVDSTGNVAKIILLNSLSPVADNQIKQAFTKLTFLPSGQEVKMLTEVDYNK